MPNKKVLVAITARPSYSRIRSALEHLRDDPSIDLWVLCSGSALLDRYGHVSSMIRADGFNVVEELYTFVEGDDLVNMALTAANTVSHTAGVAFDAGVLAALGDLPGLVCFAGHDAGIVAERLPAGMVLVRNPTGVSHAPEEEVDLEDAAAGANALLAGLERLA